MKRRKIETTLKISARMPSFQHVEIHTMSRFNMERIRTRTWTKRRRVREEGRGGQGGEGLGERKTTTTTTSGGEEDDDDDEDDEDVAVCNETTKGDTPHFPTYS